MTNKVYFGLIVFIVTLCVTIGILTIALVSKQNEVQEHKELRYEYDVKIDSLDVLIGASSKVIEDLEYKLDSLVDLSSFLGNTVVAFYAEAEERELKRKKFKQTNKETLNETYQILLDTTDAGITNRDDVRRNIFTKYPR